ncbi:hypothetical protein FDECE_5249 [Fusarium decemcellulare]|nr:hypothetical protein FDECE_5249 [Fusarium decemcellulare]
MGFHDWTGWTALGGISSALWALFSLLSLVVAVNIRFWPEPPPSPRLSDAETNERNGDRLALQAASLRLDQIHAQLRGLTNPLPPAGGGAVETFWGELFGLSDSIAHQNQEILATLKDIAGLLRSIRSATPGPLLVSIPEGGNPQRVELVNPGVFAVVLPAQFWAVSGRIARERAGLRPRGPRRRLRRSPGAVRSSQASNPGAPATPDVAAG